MMAQKTSHATALTRAVLSVATLLSAAAAGGILLSAASASVRLLSVTTQGPAVVIEATEPVAYTVNHPDPLTLIVDLRNAAVADAAAQVEPRGLVTAIRLEQATAADGLGVARVRISLARAAEYKVRSSRNTIRVELNGAAAPAPLAPSPALASQAVPGVSSAALAPVSGVRAAPKREPAARPATAAIPDAPAAAATTIEKVQTSRKGGSTLVTITGNGKLTPTGVSESKELPRRVILDFPNVASNVAPQVQGDGTLVRRVRVGLNNNAPLVTRVVMEIADGVTYTVQRNSPTNRDVTLVFDGPPLEAARSTPSDSRKAKAPGGNAAVAPATPPPAPVPAPPPAAETPAAALTTTPAAERIDEDPALAGLGGETITLAEAIANGASLAPTDNPNPTGPEAISALKTASGATTQATQQPSTTKPAPPTSKPAPSTSKPVPSTTAKPAPSTTKPPSATLKPPPAAPQTPAPAPLSVPPPGAQAPQTHQIVSGAEKKYVGHPISMDFQGVDLRSVLRTFAEISGLNMVIDPDVQGTVDIVLTDVPWDQALEVILRGNSLDYTVDGTIVRIARIDTLRKEQDARTQLALSAANAGTLAVRTYTLSYAKADQAAPLVKTSVLSPRGNVQIDPRTNTLIITDLPARLDTVAQLLSTIDRAEPQVEIEARIITTTRDYARALGVQWGFNGRVNSTIGNTTNLAFPNNGSLGGRVGGLTGPATQGSDNRTTGSEDVGTGVGLSVPGAPSAVGLALGAINGAFNLDVALSALERSGKGRILSTPRITTQNNVEAEITQGVQIPVQTEANNTVTVTFKDAALTLKVTPQITAANTVIMQITLENASPGTPVGPNLIPSIDTQRAITRVQVNDGMTTVMGGIFVSREQFTQDRTPVLHRIPFLSWLFKRDDQTDSSRELLIFITPRIQKG
jgi:type IV pilus secretin PilQ/predicted competence protein